MNVPLEFSVAEQQVCLFVQGEISKGCKSQYLFVFRRADWCGREGDMVAFLHRFVEDPDIHVAIAVVGNDGSPPTGFVRAEVAALYERAVQTTILVHADGIEAADPGLPPGFLLHIADLGIKDVLCFMLNGRRWRYRRARSGGARILFLFPGAIYPVSMGAHRRAVTMLAALAEAGCDITILHTGPNAAVRAKARPFLSLFATQIEGYANSRDRFRRLSDMARRGIYDASRRVTGQKAQAPQTFRERVRSRCNRSLRIHLQRVDDGRFDAVFVNYAWMTPALGDRRSRGALIVCDTHDVQYYRAASGGRPPLLDRLFFAPEADRKAELRTLAGTDVVLSISQRDADVLCSELGADRVIMAPSSFAYCVSPPRVRAAHAPLSFGFIGHNMAANVEALCFVLDQWWPAIRRYSPDSRFLVAGTVTQSADFLNRSYLNESIQNVGFVQNIRGFYGTLDFMLSPVTVAGGLNFKNVEAIVAGVGLLTNALGAEALRPLDIGRIVATPDELLATLEAAECDPAAETALRGRLQSDAMSLFHPDAAIAQVIERIEARRLP